MNMNAPRKVVLITGTGHCGSTLLDLILASHSSAFGVGELKDLKFHGFQPGNVLGGKDSRLWTAARARRVVSLFNVEKGYPHRLQRKVAPGTLRNRRKLYGELFAGLPDRSILVDSSKSPNYLRRSLEQLRASNITPYVIWITRDPRGVINSFVRKKGLTIADGIQRYDAKHAEVERLFSALDTPGRKVSYERLADTPEPVVRDVCEWLEIDYEPAMLRFWEGEHFHVGGNSGTKSFLAKFRGNPNATTGKEGSKEYYAHHDLAIRLDERWRTQLSAEDQASIADHYQLS